MLWHASRGREGSGRNSWTAFPGRCKLSIRSQSSIALMRFQTCLSVNAWVIHRNKDIFGDDAESFNPERWMDAERVKLMDKFLIHVRHLMCSRCSLEADRMNSGELDTTSVPDAILLIWKCPRYQPPSCVTLMSKWSIRSRNGPTSPGSFLCLATGPAMSRGAISLNLLYLPRNFGLWS
jgi:hypothetical protein